MKIYPVRLKPGSDLRQELENLVKLRDIQAGLILTCVGSLKIVAVRLPNQAIKTFKGSFEIVSLVGTLCQDDVHLHISFSDDKGRVFGGHLKQGSMVNTTAEIIIGVIQNCVFKREYDKETGFDELIISGNLPEK